MRGTTLSEADSRRRGHGGNAAQPGNYFESNIGLDECVNFFGNASEDTRIAAFEPAYDLAQLRIGHHEPVNTGLLCVFTSFLFSNINDLRIGPHFLEQASVNEPVVEYDVRLPQAS